MKSESPSPFSSPLFHFLPQVLHSVKTMSLYGWWACLLDQCDTKVTTCGLEVVV